MANIGVFIECCNSKDKDGTYQVMTLDLGYREAKLFQIPKEVVSEIADIKVSSIYNMKAGTKFKIGELVTKPIDETKI